MGITLSAADRIRTLILFIFSFHAVIAQEADYYQPGYFRYADHVYDPQIRTVILEPLHAPLNNPVIGLNNSEKLVLKFDDMGDEPADYSFRWIHCSADWEASRLSETDYTEGFFYEQISTYRHSLSTTQPYFHYRLEFPGQMMRPKISGNYLLIVFHTSDPDHIILTRRFQIAENRVGIFANIHQATPIELRTSHQEVDFQLVNNGLDIRNPYGDLRVYIVQNNRWDIVNKSLKPLYVNDNRFDYNFEDQNLFPGTNEFRFADLRTTRFQTASMEQILPDSLTAVPAIMLKKDLRRAYERYSVLDDINGRFQIRIYEGRDGDTEADYLNVKFRLDTSEPFDSAHVYVFGQLNDWALDTLNRMRWNEDENLYELEMRLKQGYYNYQYLLRGESTEASAAETEGDRFETSNEYAFYIYWLDPTLRYDRLVGYNLVTSGR